ncbi:MAG TPA: lmo0937 family membrane protein [Chloroflexia bacterium]|nr:lmo0937 family membrane protein [Chloroflexia bacterium]
MAGILWFIVVVLVAFWLLGLLVHIAGAFIHVLLVVAIIVALYNLFFSNRNRINS